MPKTKLSDALVEAKQGLSRVFAKGGERYRMTPLDRYALLGLLEFGDLGIGRDEDNTFEIPSTTDGLTTEERRAAIGGFTTDTGNFSQLLDETGDEPWFKAVRRQFPMMWWVPFKGGEIGEEVTDPDIFGWGALIDRIHIGNWRQQDNANPSDKEQVGQGIRWQGEYRYRGDYFHDYYPLEFESQIDTAVTLPMVAVTSRDILSRGTEFFAVQANNTATGQEAGSKLFVRPAFGKWLPALTLSAIGLHAANDIFIVGSNLVIPSEAAGGHVVISIADALKGTDSSTLVTTGYTTSKGPRAGIARSSSEIVFVGKGGIIYKATSLYGGVTVVDNGVVTTGNYAAVAAYKRQIVAVAAANAVAVSNDFGDTWSAVTGPHSGQALSAVSMWGEDTILIGSTKASLGAGLFCSEDFGKSWNTIPHSVRASAITDIQFLEVKGEPSGTGLLVANDDTSGSEKGVIARTNDGGASWKTGGNHIADAGSSRSLASVTIATCNNVMAVGNSAAADGLILLTERD